MSSEPLLLAPGLLFLLMGGDVLVRGGSGLATALGISPLIVGLTVVAFGTSLPELATVIVAALKHETDLILGNLIGSNIFNTLCIMGTTLLVRPMHIEFAEVQVDLAMMLLVTVAILPMLYFRGRIGRKRGTTLLVAYLIYIVALFY